jgi:hypothetical protein
MQHVFLLFRDSLLSLRMRSMSAVAPFVFSDVQFEHGLSSCHGNLLSVEKKGAKTLSFVDLAWLFVSCEKMNI